MRSVLPLVGSATEEIGVEEAIRRICCMYLEI